MNKNKLALLVVVSLSSLPFGLNAAEAVRDDVGGASVEDTAAPVERFRSNYLHLKPKEKKPKSFNCNLEGLDKYLTRKKTLCRQLNEEINDLTCSWEEKDWLAIEKGREIAPIFKIEIRHKEGFYYQEHHLQGLAHERPESFKEYPRSNDPEIDYLDSSYIETLYKYHEKCLEELYSIIDWIRDYNKRALREERARSASLESQVDTLKAFEDSAYESSEKLRLREIRLEAVKREKEELEEKLAVAMRDFSAFKEEHTGCYSRKVIEEQAETSRRLRREREEKASEDVERRISLYSESLRSQGFNYKQLKDQFDDYKESHPEFDSSDEEEEEENHTEAHVDAQPSRVGRDVLMVAAGVVVGGGALYASQDPELLKRATIRVRAKTGELAGNICKAS